MANPTNPTPASSLQTHRPKLLQTPSMEVASSHVMGEGVGTGTGKGGYADHLLQSEASPAELRMALRFCPSGRRRARVGRIGSGGGAKKVELDGKADGREMKGKGTQKALDSTNLVNGVWGEIKGETAVEAVEMQLAFRPARKPLFFEEAYVENMSVVEESALSVPQESPVLDEAVEEAVRDGAGDGDGGDDRESEQDEEAEQDEAEQDEAEQDEDLDEMDREILQLGEVENRVSDDDRSQSREPHSLERIQTSFSDGEVVSDGGDPENDHEEDVGNSEDKPDDDNVRHPVVKQQRNRKKATINKRDAALRTIQYRRASRGSEQGSRDSDSGTETPQIHRKKKKIAKKKESPRKLPGDRLTIISERLRGPESEQSEEEQDLLELPEDPILTDVSRFNSSHNASRLPKIEGGEKIRLANGIWWTIDPKLYRMPERRPSDLGAGNHCVSHCDGFDVEESKPTGRMMPIRAAHRRSEGPARITTRFNELTLVSEKTYENGYVKGNTPKRNRPRNNKRVRKHERASATEEHNEHTPDSVAAGPLEDPFEQLVPTQAPQNPIEAERATLTTLSGEISSLVTPKIVSSPLERKSQQLERRVTFEHDFESSRRVTEPQELRAVHDASGSAPVADDPASLELTEAREKEKAKKKAEIAVSQELMTVVIRRPANFDDSESEESYSEEEEDDESDDEEDFVHEEETYEHVEVAVNEEVVVQLEDEVGIRAEDGDTGMELLDEDPVVVVETKEAAFQTYHEESQASWRPQIPRSSHMTMEVDEDILDNPGVATNDEAIIQPKDWVVIPVNNSGADTELPSTDIPIGFKTIENTSQTYPKDSQASWRPRAPPPSSMVEVDEEIFDSPAPIVPRQDRRAMYPARRHSKGNSQPLTLVRSRPSSPPQYEELRIATQRSQSSVELGDSHDLVKLPLPPCIFETQFEELYVSENEDGLDEDGLDEEMDGEPASQRSFVPQESFFDRSTQYLNLPVGKSNLTRTKSMPATAYSFTQRARSTAPTPSAVFEYTNTTPVRSAYRLPSLPQESRFEQPNPTPARTPYRLPTLSEESPMQKGSLQELTRKASYGLGTVPGSAKRRMMSLPFVPPFKKVAADVE